MSCYTVTPETLLLDCRPIVSPASRLPGAGRSIHPKWPTLNTGHPQNANCQGRLVEKRWGTSSNTNERPRNPPAPARHLDSSILLLLFLLHLNTHSLTHYTSCTNTTTANHNNNSASR
jgi:hypothetical protein